jgi:hypothetical protein
MAVTELQFNVKLDNLEEYTGLHEEIRIYYVVDGYQAEFQEQDGDKTILSVHGKTIIEALQTLNDQIQFCDLSKGHQK